MKNAFWLSHLSKDATSSSTKSIIFPVSNTEHNKFDNQLQLGFQVKKISAHQTLITHPLGFDFHISKANLENIVKYSSIDKQIIQDKCVILINEKEEITLSTLKEPEYQNLSPIQFFIPPEGSILTKNKSKFVFLGYQRFNKFSHIVYDTYFSFILYDLNKEHYVSTPCLHLFKDDNAIHPNHALLLSTFIGLENQKSIILKQDFTPLISEIMKVFAKNKNQNLQSFEKTLKHFFSYIISKEFLSFTNNYNMLCSPKISHINGNLGIHFAYKPFHPLFNIQQLEADINAGNLSQIENSLISSFNAILNKESIDLYFDTVLINNVKISISQDKPRPRIWFTPMYKHLQRNNQPLFCFN